MPVEASAPVTRPAAEPLSSFTLEDVTLEQYAGISAALDDQLPLEALLANESLDPSTWSVAEVAWKERLATDGADGSLFAAFRVKRAEAEDWIGRSVTPLDDHLASWLSFLYAFSSHPAPFELFTSAGLRMNDLARLQRRWTRHMAEPSVQKQMAELTKEGVGPLPPIHAGPIDLKPFPWSKRAAKPQQPAEKAEKLTTDHADEITLDRYAAITAELAEHSSDESRVLARHGIEKSLFATIDAGWQQRLRADVALERDYRQLVAYQRARVRSSADREGRAPASDAHAGVASSRNLDAPEPVVALPPVHAAPAHLVGTSPLLEIPRGPALPFVSGAAAPEIAKSSPAEAAMARARPDLGGTALAVDAPRGPDLPFTGAAKPLAPPEASGLGGTSLAVDIPRGPALPFVAGEALPEIASGTGDPPPKRLPEGLGGTALTMDVPRGPVLPFESDSAPPAEKPPERAPSTLAETSLTVDVSRGPALPFSKDAAPALAAAPGRAHETPLRDDRLGGTALAVEAPRGPALPFAAPTRPDEAVQGKKRNALSELSLGFKIPENLPPPKQTAAAPATPPAGAAVPLLTVSRTTQSSVRPGTTPTAPIASGTLRTCSGGAN